MRQVDLITESAGPIVTIFLLVDLWKGLINCIYSALAAFARKTHLVLAPAVTWNRTRINSASSILILCLFNLRLIFVQPNF